MIHEEPFIGGQRHQFFHHLRLHHTTGVKLKQQAKIKFAKIWVELIVTYKNPMKEIIMITPLTLCTCTYSYSVLWIVSYGPNGPIASPQDRPCS